MCSFLGYSSIKLRRIRIENIQLDIPPGNYRMLTEEELTEPSQKIQSNSLVNEPSIEQPMKNFEVLRSSLPEKKSLLKSWINRKKIFSIPSGHYEKKALLTLRVLF